MYIGGLSTVFVIPVDRECSWRKTEKEKKKKKKEKFVKNVKIASIVSKITCNREIPHKFSGN